MASFDTGKFLFELTIVRYCLLVHESYIRIDYDVEVHEKQKAHVEQSTRSSEAPATQTYNCQVVRLLGLVQQKIVKLKCNYYKNIKKNSLFVCMFFLFILVSNDLQKHIKNRHKTKTLSFFDDSRLYSIFLPFSPRLLKCKMRTT